VANKSRAKHPQGNRTIFERQGEKKEEPHKTAFCLGISRSTYVLGDEVDGVAQKGRRDPNGRPNFITEGKRKEEYRKWQSKDA